MLKIKPSFFSKIFSQILYIPLMFYFWGVEATGVWIFLTSILNSVNIFNINASEYSFQELILTNKKNIVGKHIKQPKIKCEILENNGNDIYV